MLFNLLLANIITLLCFFFLFRVVFNSFFTIPVNNENVRLRLALAIPTGVPNDEHLSEMTVPTVSNDAIEILPLVANKIIKDLSK